MTAWGWEEISYRQGEGGEVFYISGTLFKKRSWRYVHILQPHMLKSPKIHSNLDRESHSPNFTRTYGHRRWEWASHSVIPLLKRYAPADPSSHQYHRLRYLISQFPSSRYHPYTRSVQLLSRLPLRVRIGTIVLGRRGDTLRMVRAQLLGCYRIPAD